MNYQEISNYLKSIKNIKTKDIVKFNKKLIAAKTDVSFLKEYAIDDEVVVRTYLEVSLRQMNSYQEQFSFIEDNNLILRDWWHVDQLTQYIIKPIDFNYAYNKAKKYVKDKNLFLRRWGYVLFLTGLEKNPKNTNKILSLIHDDEDYYVYMAEAWLICELAKYNEDAIYNFLNNTKLKYNITGRAIQKISDSYVISDDFKEKVKNLREKLKYHK